MSMDIKNDETVQLNGQFIDKDHQNIVIDKNVEKNNNIVVDLIIKTNKLIQGLTTLLDLVNDPTTLPVINESEILSSDSYGKVQEFLLTSISTINQEIAPKYAKLDKVLNKQKEAE